MWPWIIGGFILFWLVSGNKVSLHGQSTVPQLPGAAGIVQTLGLMRAMANQAIDHPLIRQQAARATEHIPRGDQKQMAVAIGEWVRAKVRYLPDPLHKEHLTNPATVAEAVQAGKKVFGDCDDMSMYVAALAKSIGLQPILRAVGKKDRFHHVYVQIQGVDIDPTVPLGTRPFTTGRALTLTV